jgi:hypothetical protein
MRLAINDLEKKLQSQEAEIRKTKQAINILAEQAGMPVPYPDADTAIQRTTHSIRSDQFYGQPLAKAVREVLEIRRAQGSGPATVKEIFDLLTQGGYAFDAKSGEYAMRGLRISLAKNSSVFHRLPNRKQWGLLSWYPKAKEQKMERLDDTEDVDDNQPADEADKKTDACAENDEGSD